MCTISINLAKYLLSLVAMISAREILVTSNGQAWGPTSYIFASASSLIRTRQKLIYLFFRKVQKWHIISWRGTPRDRWNSQIHSIWVSWEQAIYRHVRKLTNIMRSLAICSPIGYIPRPNHDQTLPYDRKLVQVLYKPVRFSQSSFEGKQGKVNQEGGCKRHCSPPSPI
jgi:hypothetical protein